MWRAHLSGMKTQKQSARSDRSSTARDRDRRVRVVPERRAEADIDKLVALVLDITEARYAAYQRCEPDPFGLPPPAESRDEGD